MADQTDHPSPRTSLAHGIMQPMPALGVSMAEATQGVSYLQAALRKMASEDRRIDQYERERAAAIVVAHKAMASSYIGAPPPDLRGDADRMVGALLKAGWTPPNTDTQTVFVLTGWSSCADSIDFGPRVFASHRAARQFADETFFVGMRGWWKQTDDRWIKWADSKHHERGFWEILARTVEADRG